MPCHSATIDGLIKLKPDDSIEKTMSLFKDTRISCAPVVDEGGLLIGQIGLPVLLKNLIPVSVSLDIGGVGSEVMIKAAPGIAKRPRKIKPLTVKDLMERNVNTVDPQSPVWEGVEKLVEFGAPLFVVDEKTGKLSGMIDEQSLFDELERIIAQDDKGSTNENE